MTMNRGDPDDDLDEPMASQSADSEAPLTHNSSKNNFFPNDEQMTSRGSFKVGLLTKG